MYVPIETISNNASANVFIRQFYIINAKQLPFFHSLYLCLPFSPKHVQPPTRKSTMRILQLDTRPSVFIGNPFCTLRPFLHRIMLYRCVDIYICTIYISPPHDLMVDVKTLSMPNTTQNAPSHDKSRRR